MLGKLLAVAALLAGLAFAAPAMAASARTTGDVNVRTGPGTGYARVGTLPAGTRVDLRGCEDNWCNVRGAGLGGWVSANYLTNYVGRPPAVVIQPRNRPPHRPRPPKPRPPRPGNCKIAPGFPCPR